MWRVRANRLLGPECNLGDGGEKYLGAYKDFSGGSKTRKRRSDFFKAKTTAPYQRMTLEKHGCLGGEGRFKL